MEIKLVRYAFIALFVTLSLQAAKAQKAIDRWSASLSFAAGLAQPIVSTFSPQGGASESRYEKPMFALELTTLLHPPKCSSWSFGLMVRSMDGATYVPDASYGGRHTYGIAFLAPTVEHALYLGGSRRISVQYSVGAAHYANRLVAVTGYKYQWRQWGWGMSAALLYQWRMQQDLHIGLKTTLQWTDFARWRGDLAILTADAKVSTPSILTLGVGLVLSY